MRSDRTQPLRRRIAQLKLELRAVRKQAQAQLQRTAQKCGHEFLALVERDLNCKIVVTDIVQKIVFQEEAGNVISETDASLKGF